MTGMAAWLSVRQVNLLVEISTRRIGVDPFASPDRTDLDPGLWAVLVDVLIDELVKSGLDEDDEPNERGLAIEG